jgi:hypothetical protein
LIPSPIVHIGFHKTATTWFQSAIFPQLTSHRFIDRELVRRLFMNGDAFDFDPPAARRALGLDEPGPPPLLSEEDLSGILHIGLSSSYIAKEMAHRIHAAMPEARILIFIRSQFTAVLSWYGQYLREGGTVSLPRYLFPDEFVHSGKTTSFKTARFDFAQLDYRVLIEEYDRLFGQDHVHVFTYEKFVSDRAGTFETMRRVLDMDFEASVDDHAGPNETYRRGLWPVARFVNLFTSRAVPNKHVLLHVPHWYVARRHILDALNRAPLFGRKPSYTKDMDQNLLGRIADRFCESNGWLAARLDLDLGSLGYPVTSRTDGAIRPVRSPLLGWTRR